MEIDIQNLDVQAIKNMPAQQYREALAVPAIRAKITEVLAAHALESSYEETPITEEVQPVEVEAVPDAEAQAAPDEAARATAEAGIEAVRVEAERVAEEARKAAEEAAKPKHFVIDFQATDTDGNPIGKKTHLEASSQEELLEKMRDSYVNAVRALDRAKRQKPTYKQEDVIKQVTQEELDAAAEDLKSTDKDVRANAVRKIASSALEDDRQAARQAGEAARQEKESLIFLKRHMTDYNNCQANNQILANYIHDNKLEWSVDNLEIALDNLEGQLAAVIVAPNPAPSSVVNPTPAVAPAAPVAPAVVVASPAPGPTVPAAVAAAPTVVPAQPAANVPPAQPVRRLGVNAGLIPGQTTRGVRPSTAPPSLTKKDLAAMSRDEYRKRLRNPDFVKQVNALLAAK